MSTNSVAQASYAFQRRRAVLRKLLPRPLRRTLRWGAHLALDGLDRCLGRKRYLVPPRSMNFVGDGNFEKTGDEFFGYFTSLGGLEPQHSVLEVGCGIGRMARPLAGYLAGGYEGFDIVPAGIEWCRNNITARHPNFHFTLADIYNSQYNPGGRLHASDYRFPYGDARFDFAFLTSVFTHMTFAGTANYLRELARVLAPGGRCLATFFLLNQESRRLMGEGLSSLEFRHPIDRAWTTDTQGPETTIGYEENGALAELLAASGFVVELVRYGCWCGRSQFLSYQDVVVLRRLPAEKRSL